MAKEIKGIQDLLPDQHNANRGTERGRYMLERSLEETGAGRSIVVDRDGNVIAGNKTLETWAEMGGEIEVVRTDGRKLVVVQREDLDLNDPTGAARKLAIYDNRTGEVNLDWDAATLLEHVDGGLDLSGLFADYELEDMMGLQEHVDQPRTLEDLAEEYGDPDESDYWPWIRVQVSPETYEVWESLLAVVPAHDEAEKVAAILSAVDTAALGEG